MRVRVGKVLLYGTGLATGGSLFYSAHKSGYDPNNIGKQSPGSWGGGGGGGRGGNYHRVILLYSKSMYIYCRGEMGGGDSSSMSN